MEVIAHIWTRNVVELGNLSQNKYFRMLTFEIETIMRFERVEEGVGGRETSNPSQFLFFSSLGTHTLIQMQQGFGTSSD